MSASGKLPALSPAGRAQLTLAMVLLIIGSGTGSWMLSACGLAVLAALLTVYLRLLPVAVLVWRRYLELLWWVERPAGEGAQALMAQRPFSLRVTLRNLGPLGLGHAEMRLLTSSSIAVTRPLPLLPLPRRSETAVSLQLQAAQAGCWFLHGAAIRLHDAAGLVHVDAYFPLPTPLRVLPRQGGRTARLPLRIGPGALEERLGAHTICHRGLGGELRELREYAPGDPFKLIAWKASARAPHGHLLVRDLDRETRLSHYLILDIGASMRQGRPGTWKLDHALELCASYVRAVLESGGSVGLITCDGAIHSHSRPGDGPLYRLHLMEQLLAVMHVVDERLCGVSDAEVCAQVARYLRQQEGLDVRLQRPPAIDDAQAWARVQVGPGGEALYDLGKLTAAARRILGTQGHSPDQDTEVQLLRQLCLRRGIELPYRGAAAHDGSQPNSRAAGLAEALRRASPVRSAQVVLLSDLDGMLVDLPNVARAAAACRRRGHTLTCLFPQTRRYLPRDLVAQPGAARIAEIFGWESDRKEAAAQAALSRLGFHVIPMGPDDALEHILGRLGARWTGRRAKAAAPAPPQSGEPERAWS